MSLCPRRDTPARAYTECNTDGIRPQKMVNGGTTRYTLSGTQVLAQQTGTDVPIYFEQTMFRTHDRHKKGAGTSPAQKKA